MKNILWNDEPAQIWREAMPLGNGRLGAMVYGGIAHEKIDLSELTFFSGEKSLNNITGSKAVEVHQVKNLLQNKDYHKASMQQEILLGNKLNYGTNLPVGSLILDFDGLDNSAKDYRNELDLSSAVLKTTYQYNGTAYKRTSFVSNPDQLFIMKIESDRENAICMKLSWDGIENPHKCEIDQRMDMVLESKAYETLQSDGKTGVILDGRIRVIASNAKITEGKQCLYIKGADSLIILVAANTNYKNENPKQLCCDQLDLAVDRGWESLLQRHMEDYQTLFQRVSFELHNDGADYSECTTYNRIQKVREGKQDLGLISLLFHYGRYLFISSSRADSPLPTHLQGVWNDNIACRIAWTCDMHLDINTQMNYWPGEILDLSECNHPLFQWIENCLMPSGQLTAKELYGLDGWTAHIFSNPWGYTAPGWGECWGLHVTGGAWIATHLWEHFLYTRDMEFLEKEALPVYTGLIRFFEGYLTKDPESGYLLPGPSISPENFFVVDGELCAVSMGATSDVIIIREILQNFLEMCQLLKKEKELADKARQVLEGLPPFQIGKYGQLQEWFYDFEESDSHHRHTSHLLGVYPFHQININSDEKMIDAVKESIGRRTTPWEAWEDTGWARALLLLYSARLQEDEWCSLHIWHTLEKLTSKNLMIFHPPTAGADQMVYELDGNTGFTTGITEMLIQSNGHSLLLLPSLPKEWQQGEIKGICAHGGVRVDLRWEYGTAVSLRLKADRAENVCVFCRGNEIELELKAGEAFTTELKWLI